MILRVFVRRLALFAAALAFFALAAFLVHVSATAPRWPPPDFRVGGWVVLCNVISASLAVGALFYSPYLKQVTRIGIVVAVLLFAVLIAGQLALDAWLYLLFGGNIYT
jgi:hypothetical protein